MLDKMSKQILKYCILHYDKKSDCCIKLTPATLNISYKLFNTATVHLIKNDLIEPCVSAYSDRDNIEIHLTSKGLYYVKITVKHLFLSGLILIYCPLIPH